MRPELPAPDAWPISGALPPTRDRYQTVVKLLREILSRLADLEHDLDVIDRTMRPYGDGTKIHKRGRRE